MQITCASCKSVYTMTPEQVKGLSFSILPCKHCNKFIKVSACPHCDAYYSITFSSTRSSTYRLTCERCGNPFTIDFPLIKEAKNISENRDEGTSVKEKKSISRRIFGRNNEKAASRPRKTFPLTAGPSQRAVSAQTPARAGFTLPNLLSICGSAFTPFRLGAAAIAIIIAAIMLSSLGWLTSQILSAGDTTLNPYLKSFLNVIPFAIIFFIYIMAAAVIARRTMDDIESRPQLSAQGALLFLARSLAPVFVANTILFIAIDLVFILFGKIPVIGPVLFALLFLPIYAVSLCIVILLAIGFWFYPPIIADSPSGAVSPIRGLLLFIRDQKFSLAYAIPLMTIITSIAFAAVYIVHYMTFSLSMFISRNVLFDESEKIFSAIPAVLLRVAELGIPGSDFGLFRSLIGSGPLTHTIGGVILGVIFSLISILLFASFISISATLSTWIYAMMKNRTDMDDTAKIRVLLLLVLILLGIFLVKKIMF